MKQQRDRRKAPLRVCSVCGLLHGLRDNGVIYWHKGCAGSGKPPQPESVQDSEAAHRQRAHILSEFESTLAAQLARINTRLTHSAHRVFNANAGRKDDGPYVARGISALAYEGDSTDVEIKK